MECGEEIAGHMLLHYPGFFMDWNKLKLTTITISQVSAEPNPTNRNAGSWVRNAKLTSADALCMVSKGEREVLRQAGWEEICGSFKANQ